MAHVEKKLIKGRPYYYLKESKRVNGKVRTRTLAYFGKKKPSKQDVETAKYQIIQHNKFLSSEQIAEIDKIRADFESKSKLPEELQRQMWADFITNFVFNTNAIEGNTIDKRETAELLYEGRSPSGKDLREIYDHINSKEAFEYILSEKPDINNNIIIDLHSKLMKNIDKRVRAYRTHDVRVLGATFESSPAQYVNIDMDLIIRWYCKYRKKLHPFALAVLFHHKFEKIHPFYDGNGRTGRMLLNLILLRNGLPPLVIEKSKKTAYCEALSKADKSGIGEITPDIYKAILDYCYNAFRKTYAEVFSKWG